MARMVPNPLVFLPGTYPLSVVAVPRVGIADSATARKVALDAVAASWTIRAEGRQLSAVAEYAPGWADYVWCAAARAARRAPRGPWEAERGADDGPRGAAPSIPHPIHYSVR